VAVLLLDVLPRPATGLPASLVTVKFTTGGLAIVTPVTVTFGASAAQAADEASVAGAALAGMVTCRHLASEPLGAWGPGPPRSSGAGSPVLPPRPRDRCGHRGDQCRVSESNRRS
jgi:hypothetical protein